MSQRQEKKHVMISYQWNVQELVLKTYDFLAEKDIAVWMDIKAGIPSANLYEGYL